MNDYNNSEETIRRKMVARLKGVPVFFIDRPYVTIDHDGLQWFESHWNFKFDNGWGASVIKFLPHPPLSCYPYEIGLMDSEGSLCSEAIVAKDMIRCYEEEVDVWLTIISNLSPCGQFFIWTDNTNE